MNAKQRRTILRLAYDASKEGILEHKAKHRVYETFAWSVPYGVRFKYAMTCCGCKMPKFSGLSYTTKFYKGWRGTLVPTSGAVEPKRWLCTHCHNWNDWPTPKYLRKPTRRNDKYMKRQSRPR